MKGSLVIDIRQAESSELEQAAELAVRAFAALGALTEPADAQRLFERVRASTSDPHPGVVIVAAAEDRIVGTVIYNSPGEGQHPLFPGDWAFFRSIGVDSAYGGRGIGRRLVEACIERARNDGAAWLGLYAADANEVAVRLYRNMGFRQTGDAPSYWGLSYHIYGFDLSGD